MLVNIPRQLAVGVATDCKTGDIYWTDAAYGKILRSKKDGTQVETIVTGLSSPEGIAVDHSGGNIYFTDSALDVLQVARLDGSGVTTLVNTDMVNPRAIVIDVQRGIIFWTDWMDWRGGQAQIERMNMDGSGREVLVRDGLDLPNGLAYDPDTQMVYWGDAGTKTIECIRSDGLGRRIVFDKAPYPFDLTLLGKGLFWSDWQTKAIPNMNINGRQPNESVRLAFGGRGRTYGITTMMETCPPEGNACGYKNGGVQFSMSTNFKRWTYMRMSRWS